MLCMLGGLTDIRKWDILIKKNNGANLAVSATFVPKLSVLYT